ncbi:MULTISPECIES: haloacid dehalogenase type II [Paraburkholderia]|uniref:2-haloacid dehalogenase n=1 Tax=Paraburkholderia megapolitana TaxID=420953 RepID=A0A1I3GCU2_9BURK|nr:MULTISPECIES: haloacid dehalogenase type II [Paraburkholderia]MCX4160309.1 haloacid dehalogenase type II [Paraburkholderia megapolitana]MDN7155808.1 haloacid dehalogenase type II [Paraburkholderia sp. CHISQ3]MDQ6492852.1 haloacid dehalogenase type II [Paraburkholderia megapolitana]QDQ82849.1 haloacid dehalogenase type II [Paraburkholderia megapolitana]SFI21300.1 2-haloacid dehalogenase [Paraburkholderia megapolitana]
MNLADFDTLTFDCYGTLIDWETGILDGLRPLLERVKRPLTRDQVLEAHARHEASQQIYTPAKRYQELLAIVYKRLAEEWQVAATLAECIAYGKSIQNWPAFEDSPGALQYLKKHYKLVILSNIDNESFAYSNAKLQVEFDGVITAEDVGSYKPSLRNFEYLLEKLGDRGIRKEKILHTAESLFHDHKPANELGLASCWINRRHAKQGFGATLNPGTQPTFDFRFDSMGDLVKAHQQGSQQQ